MSDQGSESKPSSEEKLRELLIRRGSEAAERVIAARQSAGMGDGTIGTSLAIQYLRSAGPINDHLAQEVAMSRQPDLNSLITIRPMLS